MTENNDRLVSWKEIASYLGCDVRTCLRWEKERGLPVHRPGGQPGPRVMASKKELDDWLAGSSHLKETTAPPLEPVESGRLVIKRKWITIFVLLAVLGIAGFLGVRALTMDREPADFRIDGSRLVILNAAKSRLWDFDTKMENLWPEAEYRTRFQTRQWEEKTNFNYSPSLVIQDIDKDGHSEVLFVPHPDPTNNSRRLYCFDYRGKIRWNFEGGREIIFGTKSYSWDYFAAIETHDIDDDGRQEIFVLSDSLVDFPSHLAILSADKTILGEYWQSGRITDLALADLDGDGRQELLVGGVDEERYKAFVAVFDPLNLRGSSPNTGRYKSPTLLAGTEKAYILLPWTDIDPGNDRHVVLSRIRILNNGRIELMTFGTKVLYELDPKTLACLDVTFSNAFEVKRREYVRAGRVSGSIDEAYRENLKKGLLYWTGRIWTSTPSAVIH
jgi:hypothetical protein